VFAAAKTLKSPVPETDGVIKPVFANLLLSYVRLETQKIKRCVCGGVVDTLAKNKTLKIHAQKFDLDFIG
jgi:hypothetical protein